MEGTITALDGVELQVNSRRWYHVLEVEATYAHSAPINAGFVGSPDSKRNNDLKDENKSQQMPKDKVNTQTQQLQQQQQHSHPHPQQPHLTQQQPHIQQPQQQHPTILSSLVQIPPSSLPTSPTLSLLNSSSISHSSSTSSSTLLLSTTITQVPHLLQQPTNITPQQSGQIIINQITNDGLIDNHSNNC